MSIDQIVGYEKLSGRRYKPLVPDWVYQQSLNYPHHPRHSELIEQYRIAKQQHDESLEVLQSSIERKLQNEENLRLIESVKQCQHQVEATRKTLEQAEQSLREFNNHTPEQRIILYELEIKEWETQLVEARRAEQEYTKQLLDDPDAAAKRLERIVNGYSGEKAEYSVEQLSKLRSLKGEVESIEVKIINSQRDIERIHELVAQSERSSQIQATMDAALPKFSEACARLAVAWGELQTLAAEYDIRIVNQNGLKIPLEATYRQRNNPYEGASTINIIFSK